MASGRDIELFYRARYNHVPRHQFDYFMSVADQVRLDPWKDQIFCEMQKDHRRRGAKVLKIFIGIGGARTIADRTDERDGAEPAEFERDEAGKIILARKTVYRRRDGRRTAYTAEARMDEYYNGEADPIWKQYPSVCLDRCAEMRALREAFSDELNGLHLREEVRSLGEGDGAELPDAAPDTPSDVPESDVVDRGTLQRFLIGMGLTNLVARADVTDQLRAEFKLADDPAAYAQAAAAVRANPVKYGVG